jgi:hypothetical protein
LEQSAKEYNALQRKRKVKSAADLLRLGLGYSLCDLSLRQTSSWSSLSGIADISNVAVLKRLKAGVDWFGHLLAKKLEERVSVPQTEGLKVRLLDATSLSLQGSTQADWRIHVGYELSKQRVYSLDLTNSKTGESLQHYTNCKNELLIADSAYLNIKAIQTLLQHNSHVLIRLQWGRLSLFDREGNPMDLLQQLAKIKPGEVLDLPIQFSNKVPGRLIALQQTEAATARSQHKAKRKAQQHARPLSSESLEIAKYFIVFTTLEAQTCSATQVLELYRFRWQIELAFKRFKSLCKLDEMTAKDPLLCRSFLTLNLLAAILTEELSEEFRSFSPWGYGTKGLVCLAPV